MKTKCHDPEYCTDERCDKVGEKDCDGTVEGEMDKKEWLDRYAKRLLERGLDKEEIEATIQCTIYPDDPLDDDPEDAADTELSYWASDG